MTRTPPKLPIVPRRASRGNGDDVGPMFWAAVVVGLVLAIAILAWGGR